MQFILTAEEYQALTALRDLKISTNKAELQEVCSMVADHVPLSRSWDAANTSPWGCVITVADSDHVCDHCLAVKVCPSDQKNFSSEE